MPCLFSNDTSAVTFKVMPNAEPLPVAIALTIEIAPCIVARTLFVIWVLQTIQREPFSLLPWEHSFLSRFQKFLLLVYCENPWQYILNQDWHLFLQALLLFSDFYLRLEFY